jgi:magnesium-transporting ATPase (P-type)
MLKFQELFVFLFVKSKIVRNSSIPEELGRISYLFSGKEETSKYFSDKTGTLTQNVFMN